MARRNVPKTINLRAGPTLHIDDDLLSEALAAVEHRASSPTPVAQNPDSEDDSEIQIDIAEPDQEDTIGVVTIQTLSDDLVMALEPLEPDDDADEDSPSMFEIPEDLLDVDDGTAKAPPRKHPDDERTDPAGIKPRRATPPPAAVPTKPITADPKMLARVSRMRKRVRQLQRRSDELQAELDKERQAQQAVDDGRHPGQVGYVYLDNGSEFVLRCVLFQVHCGSDAYGHGDESGQAHYPDGAEQRRP